MYIFKTSGVKSKYNNKGNLLLVERPQFIRRVPWDTYNEFTDYFEDCYSFETLKSKTWTGYNQNYPL